MFTGNLNYIEKTLILVEALKVILDETEEKKSGVMGDRLVDLCAFSKPG